MRRGSLLPAIVVAVGLAAPAGAQTVKAGTALFAYDSGEPLDLVVTDSSVQADVLILDITYASPVRGRVPAFLFVPEAEGPHAGLLLLHGLPGSRNDLRSLAAEYARRGAVGLTISAPFARPDGPRSNPVTFTEQDRDEQIQLIKDLRRGVDLLVARDDVDRGRLGFVGGSYGGAMGGLLAGVEDRIKAYALFVGDGGLVAHFTGPEDLPPVSAEQFDRWKALMEPIEPLRFVGQAAPAELLFQQGRVDRMVPPADAEEYTAAGSEPKTVLWYDHGHQFSQEMRRDQIAWLTERLGLHSRRMEKKPES